MKTYIKYLIFMSFILVGCNEHYVYVKPQYPEISQIRKVPEIKGAFLRKGCLWLDHHNTNLCGNDLKVILTQIKKFRVNESTCRKKIANYNEFVKKKRESK